MPGAGDRSPVVPRPLGYGRSVESLALVVTLVVVSIVVVGVAALVVAWRNPERAVGRVAGAVIGALAVAAGGWLALLDVGIGARVIGGLVALAGLVALTRSARSG